MRSLPPPEAWPPVPRNYQALEGIAYLWGSFPLAYSNKYYNTPPSIELSSDHDSFSTLSQRR